MDSFSDEFQTYWMSIFYTEIVAIPVLGGLGALALWLTRDRDIMALSPHDELRRFYAMFGILTVAAIAIVSALGLLTEADAAWHQVVVRDTDFTPTHIFLFYLGIPAAWGALILAWIWVHTRLPIFANRISVPFSVAILGFMMVGPVVAFNEWAHTFFYAEELFAAPVHWFFVLAGFFLVFLIGFVAQCLQRMRELMHVVSYEELERLATERWAPQQTQDVKCAAARARRPAPAPPTGGDDGTGTQSADGRCTAAGPIGTEHGARAVGCLEECRPDVLPADRDPHRRSAGVSRRADDRRLELLAGLA